MFSFASNLLYAQCRDGGVDFGVVFAIDGLSESDTTAWPEDLQQAASDSFMSIVDDFDAIVPWIVVQVHVGLSCL